MIVADGTYYANALSWLALTQSPPAEVRNATSLIAPERRFPVPAPVGTARITASSIVESQYDDSAVSATAAASSPTAGSMGTPEVRMVPWLSDTIEIIDVRRGLLKAHAADFAYSNQLLVTAEMLASLFATLAPSRRPQVNIDDEGHASFSTQTREFYLHLTVDSPGRLTWYAVIKNAEYFEENVDFAGRKLPDDLRKLFTL